MPVLDTAIIERSAFRDIFDCGGTLHTMDPMRVSNLDKARENAHCFAEEIIRKVPGRLPVAVRLANAMGRAARRRAEQAFDIETAASRLVDQYQLALAGAS